jgi:hypothetical protein
MTIIYSTLSIWNCGGRFSDDNLAINGEVGGSTSCSYEQRSRAMKDGQKTFKIWRFKI